TRNRFRSGRCRRTQLRPLDSKSDRAQERAGAPARYSAAVAGAKPASRIHVSPGLDRRPPALRGAPARHEFSLRGRVGRVRNNRPDPGGSFRDRHDRAPIRRAEGGRMAILFAPEQRRTNIWGFDLTGSAPLQQLTHDDSLRPGYYGTWPALSGDGNVLAFITERAGSPDICLKDLRS